jgi:hypothetical protein
MAFGTTGPLWPNATIPYEIDSADFPPGSAFRQMVNQAIDEWNNNTVIRLVPRQGESDYIIFESTGSNCASGVGLQRDRQNITCNLRGNFSASSVMHEIGHAVGFFHEHQRPDRRNFVSVGSTSDRVNCDDPDSGRLLTSYDCDSIMHYPQGTPCNISLIQDGCSGIIGLATRLSGRDVWGASLLYGIPLRSVIVWEDDSDDDGSFQIHASGFVENGRRGCGPLIINRSEKGQHRMPAVGMSGNGDMVFVWADDSDGNGFSQIKMRGFGANGRQRISERTVNTIPAGQQIAPHVAVANDGRFVVVWQDDSDRDGEYLIRVRGFESDGAERFSQLTVNTNTRGQHTAPRVASAPDGFFVVVWESDSDGNGFTNIRMRGFNADGTQRWPERQVHRRSRGQQRRPRIAMGPSGDFVVVWEDDGDNNTFYEVRMRAFTADGGQKFSERTVNRVSKGQQLEPDVAVDDVFRPVVVWADDRDNNGFLQILMRGFESDGRVRLLESDDGRSRVQERTVNTHWAGQQRRPAIAMEANGRFTVAWEDDQDNDDKANLLIRSFSANGRELHSSRDASNTFDGHKGCPCVAAPAMSWLDVLNPL